MSSNSSSLDPRVQRTRTLLEEAFLTLLYQEKFQSITIQQITDQAGVNRVTFYAHYADKYDLYRQIVRKTFQQIWAEHHATASDGPAQLAALVQSACVFFQQLNTACPPTDRQSRPLVEVEVQHQLYQHLLTWLTAEQAQGLVLPASLETTAKMMSWAIFGIGLDWEQTWGGPSVDEMSAEIFAVVGQFVGGVSA